MLLMIFNVYSFLVYFLFATGLIILVNKDYQNWWEIFRYGRPEYTQSSASTKFCVNVPNACQNAPKTTDSNVKIHKLSGVPDSHWLKVVFEMLNQGRQRRGDGGDVSPPNNLIGGMLCAISPPIFGSLL